jgi:hypothetical protein
MAFRIHVVDSMPTRKTLRIGRRDVDIMLTNTSELRSFALDEADLERAQAVNIRALYEEGISSIYIQKEWVGSAEGVADVVAYYQTRDAATAPMPSYRALMAADVLGADDYIEASVATLADYIHQHLIQTV